MIELFEEDFDEMYEIMEESFPKEERRTYEGQKKLLSRSDYHVYGYRKDGCLLGFLALYDQEDFVFIEHFALSSKIRGKGIGTRILKQLITDIRKPTVFEVELPETQIAKRRIRLYKRLGGTLYKNIEYLMPSLHGEEAIPLMLMSFTKDLSEEQMRSFVPKVYKDIYGAIM